MKRYFKAILKKLKVKTSTKTGQILNLRTGRYIDTKARLNNTRPSVETFKHLHSVGYDAHSYKLCLQNEAQILRARKNYGSPNSAWAGVYMPTNRLLVYQLKTNILNFANQLKRYITRAKVSKDNRPSTISSAGLFMGMDYQYFSSESIHSIESDYYETLNRQAVSTLNAYKNISGQHKSKEQIGILVSCYQPEEHIDGFLDNLIAMESQERLIPTFINAGMSNYCREKIISRLSDQSFKNFIFLDRPGCGIYSAWNMGVKELGKEVKFLTNFNVDDRRHPLCFDLQAECLNAFPTKMVSVTDYTYFFRKNNSIEDLFVDNCLKRTYIPIINVRSLIDRNFPHAGPMWRQCLHENQDCGLFDEQFKSAGDAEFWYRVSRRHPKAFTTISLPLSLYYQNPKGLSTKPKTEGPEEHASATKSHYRHIISEINKSVSEEFSERYIDLGTTEHMQLHAATKYLFKK